MLETKVAVTHFYMGDEALAGRLNKDSAEIRYLLGTISPEEAIQLEEGYFADNAKFEQFEIAEEQLIDAYVRNQLSPEETQQFKTRLLKLARITERVNFARALAEKADAYELPGELPVQEVVVPSELPRELQVQEVVVPWWQRFLPAQSALRVAFAACFLIFAIGSLISIATWLRLRSESERVTSERASLQKQKEELDKRALELEGKNQQLTADLQKQRDELAQERQRLDEVQGALDSRQPDRSLTGITASILLSPGLTRSPDQSPQLTIHPNTSTAKISLDLEGNDYRTYRAVLKNTNSTQIFSQDRLRVRDPARSQIDFVVPARVLTPRTYLITVSGRTPSGAFEDVADYMFRATRK
jgi:hypothetical protein